MAPRRKYLTEDEIEKLVKKLIDQHCEKCHNMTKIKTVPKEKPVTPPRKKGDLFWGWLFDYNKR